MSTVRHQTFDAPIRTLVVEVIAGLDRGLTRASDGEACTVGTATDNQLLVRDPSVSRYHVELGCHPNGVLVTDHASTNGTWLGAVRIERAVVPPASVLRIGDTQIRVGDGPTTTIRLHSGGAVAGIVGSSAPMRRLFTQLERVAQSDASVLVVGESGTGKELVARAIHDLGQRRAAPFVIVDCGAIAPTLVASELFGHERGAFTGADRAHVGAIERAHGGTVFFDEIGELPLSLQSTLLGVLQRRRFRRIGGRDEIPVDVRIVSATHRDLRAEVNASTFRLDLFYRLAVVVLRVPALRDRLEDVPLLVESFLREAGHPGPIEDLFSAETIAQLASQRWSGNVRELRNVIESTLAMGELPDAPVAGEAPAPDASENLPYRTARDRVLADFEAGYLTRLHARTKGNVSLAAREAKMDRSHLVTLLRKHGIKS